jgi:hypothetical protein
LNCIFYRDSSASGKEIYLGNNTTYDLLYTDIDTTRIVTWSYVDAKRKLKNVNPFFVSAPSDFHLQTTSACVDSGRDTLFPDNEAFDGVIRDSLTWDMGAYENEAGGPKILVKYDDNLPRQSSIGKAYPNPFNSSVSIEFDVTGEKMEQDISMKVYSINGQLVRALINEPLPGGKWRVIWDGRDNQGRPASSGAYLISLKVEGIQLDSKTVSLVK